jgi:hypothetical protein
MPQLTSTAAAGQRAWPIWRLGRRPKAKRAARGLSVWQLFAVRRQIDDTFDGGLVTLGLPEGL